MILYYTTGVSNIDDKAYGLRFIGGTSGISYLEYDDIQDAKFVERKFAQLFKKLNELSIGLNLKIKISIERD